MGLTTALVVAWLVAAGSSVRLGIFIGLFVALSSTAIVLKELGERNQLDSPHGRLMIGVLLLQDLCIVVLLLLVPILSGATEASAVPGVLLRALGALALLAVVSRIVLPPLFRLVTSSGRREAFPLLVILSAVGVAFMALLLGLSMALGAFLAGLVLAESEFSHQAHAEVRPLRDILAGLFFISLGMLVDLRYFATHLPIVLALAAGVLIVKTVGASGALLLSASPLRVAVTAAVGLAQVGEFSFILGRAGLEAGLLNAELWQTLLAASILTMIATPLLVGAAPAAGVWLARRLKRSTAGVEAGAQALPHLTNHVVIIGFGVGGRMVARALRDLGVPYLVCELNGDTVRESRATAEPIIYGDATNPDALHAAGVDRASAVVLALSDPAASMRSVRVIRSLAPRVTLVVRTRYHGEARALIAAGATIAVAEELEASLEMLGQLLARLDIPGNVIDVLVDRFRVDAGGIRTARAPAIQFGALPEAIARAPVSTYQLQDEDWAVGQTLREINLRAETGALIVAVKRKDRYITSPAADLSLEGHDTLYLLGDESDVMLARRRLGVG
jgi:CPA2 family monovalent cation:H+ antiporter-2